MELKELKKNLLDNKKIKLPLNLVNLDSSNFLLKEYLNKISKVMNLELKEVQNVQEIEIIESDVFSTNNYLFILRPKEENSIDEDKILDSKVIVIYNKDIKESKLEKVILPKPLEWQIEDLIKTLVPGLDKAEIAWLCKITKYDINRLYFESQKIGIFNKKDQDNIFNLINKENGYCDLNDLNIFNLSNAILKRDFNGIHNVVRDLDNIDIEGTGLVTILLNNMLKVINIQLNSKATASSLGIPENQFRAIKYNCFKYTNDRLIDIYEFLTSIDYKLKSGLLEMTNSELVYYIISNIIK